MTNSVTIAQLTDVHLGPIAGFLPRYWNVKRALGYANWLLKRRWIYRREVLDRLVADIAAQAPDHIVVTGDLANLGLPREHINALSWLERLGSPERVTVIPGNHDIYSAIGADPGTARWAPFMAPDAAGAAYTEATGPFPFVRMAGPVALVAMNSAVPTPPFVASGRLGDGQLGRLGPLLQRLARDGKFRLVLIHHPPLPGLAKPRRELLDAAALQDVLARHGAELVIHGHNHHNSLTWCATETGTKLPIVGAPSGAQGRRYKDEPLGRYNLYRVGGPPWAVELVARGLAEPDGPVLELERTLLASSSMA